MIARRCATAILIMLIAASGCRSEQGRASLEGSGADARVVSADLSTGDAIDAISEATQQRLSAIDHVAFYTMSVSPSGRYLSMIDPTTAGLAVQDLSTGKMHRLTDGNAVGEYPGGAWESAGVSAFSPDGRSIAYAWERSERPMQIRRIDIEPDAAGTPRPTEPEVVFESRQFAPYYVYGWSPDGREILVLGYPGGSAAQLALVSATDGTRRVLKSFDWREPLLAVFSPDGRYVAYDYMPDIDSPNRDVYALSLDGAQDGTVIDGPAIDRLLGWHPDGSILFHSDRGGTPGVWSIAMSEGRPAGPATLVKADMWGVQPIGFAGRRFHYGVSVNPQRLYIAPVDLKTGVLTGAPEAVGDPARVHVSAWDWSSDGKLLAYAGANGGDRAALFGRGPTEIAVRNSRGEVVQSLQLDLGRPSRLRWAPGGRSLIVWASDTKGRRGLYRIDFQTGSYSMLVGAAELGIAPRSGHFDISPDGQTLWFARRDTASAEQPLTLVAYDLSDGSSAPVAPIEPADEGFVSISPDGERLAIITPGSTSGTISTIPVDGGPASPLYVVPSETRVLELEWTHDGKEIIFSTHRSDSLRGGQWKTWVVPASGGQARPLDLGDHVNPRGMRLSPDGARIGFLAGEARGEIWALDGLAPTAPAARERERKP